MNAAVAEGTAHALPATRRRLGEAPLLTADAKHSAEGRLAATCKRRDDLFQRRAAKVARWVLAAATAAGIAGAALGLLMPARSAVTPAGLVTAGIGAVLLVILIAVEFDFDQRRVERSST